MLKVKSNGVISMSRGDTISLDVNITDSEGNDYELKEGEELYFSAKEKPTDKMRRHRVCRRIFGLPRKMFTLTFS
jgi:hypothetical protein